MAALDALLRCTIGTTGFQLTSCKLHEEPIVREGAGLGYGRLGTKIVVTAKGWVEGATAELFGVALWAVKGALSTPGQNFIVYGPGDRVEVSILAACVLDGGPHITFDVEDGAINHKEISFTVNAQTARVGGGGGGSDTPPGEDPVDFYEALMKVAVRPDGLSTITYTGEIRGPNVLARFATGLVGFNTDYPSNWWVKNHDYEVNEAGDRLSYTLTAVRLKDEQPVMAANAAIDIVLTYSREVDEGARCMETWAFDGIVDGDPQVMANWVRGRFGGDPAILRESFTVTSIKERRVSASFTIVKCFEAGGVMCRQETLRFTKAATVYDVKQYPGLDPILVERAKTVGRLVQSGSAISVNGYPAENGPVLPTMLEAPEILHSVLNAIERKTEWTYVMAVTESDWDLSKLVGGG